MKGFPVAESSAKPAGWTGWRVRQGWFHAARAETMGAAMTISDEIRAMVRHWIDTGEWEALHDALVEDGFHNHALHLRENRCQYQRHECLIVDLIQNPTLAIGYELPDVVPI